MQAGMEMYVNLVKYHVYPQHKAGEHKANLSIDYASFDERWNIVYDSGRHFGIGYRNDFFFKFPYKYQ